MRWVMLVALCACSTTIKASNYTHDCDADNQCVRIFVGDVCSCTCTLAAINVRDEQKYLNDLENIGTCENPCTGDGGDAGFQCGVGIGAACSAGTCVNVMVDAGAD